MQYCLQVKRYVVLNLFVYLDSCVDVFDFILFASFILPVHDKSGQLGCSKLRRGLSAPHVSLHEVAFYQV